MASAARRRDPYDVLGVSKESSDREIKSAYRKLALKLHPDRNANDPETSELFIEVASSYNILSDPERRKHYDTYGFENPEDTDSSDEEPDEVEIDLASVGMMRTLFFALLSKLGVAMKTSISATVFEEALVGSPLVRLLPLGRSFSDKVDKQGVKYFGVSINKRQAREGMILKVSSFRRSRFKLLYFEQRATGGCELALQEESERYGQITTAGMYFMEGLQPGKLSAGMHLFAVYGDNFVMPSKFSVEALSAKSFELPAEKLKEIEAKISEAADQEEEEEFLAKLLRERDTIRASFTTLINYTDTSCFSF